MNRHCQPCATWRKSFVSRGLAENVTQGGRMVSELGCRAVLRVKSFVCPRLGGCVCFSAERSVCLPDHI